VLTTVFQNMKQCSSSQIDLKVNVELITGNYSLLREKDKGGKKRKKEEPKSSFFLYHRREEINNRNKTKMMSRKQSSP